MEELPAQPVLRRGSPRLGLGGTFAVAAMVALLAAGFGVLGGRPDAEPVPTSVAVGPSAPTTTAIVGPHASPRVTPWIECGEPPTTTPSIYFQVNGVPIQGVVEVVEFAPDGSLPSPAGSSGPFLRERVDVPIDVTNELWVAGAPCAVAWSIDLVDDQNLETVSNQARDPAYAAQNRFQLFLGSHRGGDVDLRAVLVFPTLVARATWPIRILPIEEPVAALYTDGPDIRPVEGCDVTLTLATGWSNPLNPCVDDVGEPPDDATPVRPGERLSFEINGWATAYGGVVCGRLSGHSFIAQPEPGCNSDEVVLSPFVFAAPSESGRWTLAMSACGSIAANAFPGRNQICGTWYANIVVED